jgi:2-polyprenyl-6-methoxyphenol hydroxylase-like FAD-dependent oxidoreductase
MMRINNALIIGGGIAGMSAAICLSRIGVQVDLIDLDPQWRVYGAGITITGPTLRALKALGVIEQVLAHAYVGNGIRVCSVDGTPIRDLPTPMPADAGVPGSGGIMRPVLHRILSEQVLSLGVRVRLGVTVDTLTEVAAGVAVSFNDGTMGNYDLVVGADGLFSRARQLLFPQAPVPSYTGQSCWRLVVPRPSQIDRRHFFLGGPVKVGLSPVSGDEMYLFLLQNRPQKDRVEGEQLHLQLRGLLTGYGGVLSAVREQLDEHSRIVFRPLEAFFLPAPWHRGRVVLIGDAVHPTTPQLASGAGMAVEDGLVLAEELQNHDSLDRMWTAFMARRYERCMLVVRNSMEVGRLEQRGAPIAEQTEIVERSLAVLAQPI